jgi:hypothetical protein
LSVVRQPVTIGRFLGLVFTELPPVGSDTEQGANHEMA